MLKRLIPILICQILIGCSEQSTSPAVDTTESIKFGLTKYIYRDSAGSSSVNTDFLSQDTVFYSTLQLSNGAQAFLVEVKNPITSTENATAENANNVGDFILETNNDTVYVSTQKAFSPGAGGGYVSISVPISNSDTINPHDSILQINSTTQYVKYVPVPTSAYTRTSKTLIVNKS